MLNWKIIDIMDDNLNFKPLIDLNKDMNTMITQMKYNSLRSAIPADWKKMIQDTSKKNKRID